MSETEAKKAEAKGLTPIYFAKFDGPDWSLFLINQTSACEKKWDWTRQKFRSLVLVISTTPLAKVAIILTRPNHQPYQYSLNITKLTAPLKEVNL